MKKGFILSWLLLPALVLGGFIGAATAAEKPQYGGTLRFLDMSPGLSPMTWDNADWVWKHGHDTGFYMEHLMMGDLQKGPRGTNQYAFHASAWIPPDVARGELLEKWEVKKNPLRIVFHLRKGVYWQEKPGVMKSREFVADDVVYSMTRLKKCPQVYPPLHGFHRPVGSLGQAYLGHAHEGMVRGLGLPNRLGLLRCHPGPGTGESGRGGRGNGRMPAAPAPI